MKNIEQHSKPAGTTDTTLFTSSGESTTISSIVVCNTNASDDTFNLYVIPSGLSVGDAYAIVKGATIEGNDTLTFTLGITPAVGSFISVYSTNGYCAFSLYGRG